MDLNRNYNALKQDPQLLLTLISKYVKVEIIKNVIYNGYVLALDPESYSIVLAVSDKGEFYKNVLVPGHAILNIEEDTFPMNVKPFVVSCKKVSSEDVSERKLKIMSWFKKNLLPVSELDENIVLGNAYILPPYSVLDICTENPIVVNQLRNLISKMPVD